MINDFKRNQQCDDIAFTKILFCMLRNIALLLCGLLMLLTFAVGNILLVITWPFPVFSYYTSSIILDMFARECVFVLLSIMGAKFTYSGDEIISNESGLIISNHQSYLDFVVYYALLLPKGMAKYIKAFMKDSLRYIPFFGTFIVGNKQILVKRSWNEDQTSIMENIRFLMENKLPVLFGIFPEATRITVKKLKEVLFSYTFYFVVPRIL